MGLKQKVFGSGGVKGQYNKMKQKAYGSKGVRGRYDPTRTGSLWTTIDNLKKDFNTVKDRLNVEKNYKDLDLTTNSFGQVDGNLAATWVSEITPSIPQGDGKGQRIGNSLKCTGISMPISFQGQTNTLSGRKIRVSLIRSRGKARTVSEVLEDLYDENPINNLRDFNAPRKYTKGNGLAVVRSKTYYLRPPALDNSSIGTVDTERSNLTIKFNVKLKDTIRYDDDSSTFPDNIRYFIMFQTDVGNTSGSTVSTLDVPVVSISSGINFKMAERFWYVDN